MNGDDLIKIHAGGSLVSGVDNFEATGSEGTIDISVGGNLTMNSTLTATKRITLESQNGDLTLTGTLRGSTGGGGQTQEVSLRAGNDVTIDASANASDLIEVYAGNQITGSNVNLTANGTDGTIILSTEGDFNANTTLSAGKRVEIESETGNLTVSGTISELVEMILNEVAFTAGQALNLAVGIDALDSIALVAGTTITANGSELEAAAAAGSISASATGNITMNSALKAGNRVEAVSDSGNLIFNGSIEGISGGQVDEVSLKALSASKDVSLNASILAGDLVEIAAGNLLSVAGWSNHFSWKCDGNY